MKKRLAILLLCIALMTSLLCGTVAAAEPTTSGIYGLIVPNGNISVTVQTAAGTEIIADDSATINNVSEKFYADAEKITVTISDVQAASYYLVVAQSKQGAPTEDTGIVYIDQQSANGTTVTFVIYPSQLDEGKYYVYFTSNAESGTITNKSFVADSPAITFSYYTPYPKGDVDGNTRVNINDALRVLQRIVGYVLTDGELARADVNGDGAININDALAVMQMIVGNS